MDANWKCNPLKHQLEHYLTFRDHATHCLWWEQGTGKTAACIATVAHLWRTKRIQALLVVAPGGVEANWVYDEIPDHLPDDIERQCMVWSTRKRNTRAHRDAYSELMNVGCWKLPVLAISYDAIMTDDGAKAVKAFLEKYRCMYVADETTRIKTPGTKVTKRVVASSKYAPYRRVLNGTPVTDSPFHAYSQVKFADPNAWARLGVGNFAAFQAFFGVWEKITRKDQRTFPKLVSHRNLDVLNKVMKDVGTRVLKADVLDLPPKVYTKRRFDLSPAQSKLYQQLRDEFFVWLAAGQEVTAEQSIVRLMRLQQICSGYVKYDESDELTPIEENNPRIQCLEEALEEVTGKAIIFAKYDADIDSIMAMLKRNGHTCVQYDGRTDDEDRENAKRSFQSSDGPRFFVAKPTVAGRGLTLHAATTVIYYNNDFVLDNRLQSEDRAHRIGQKNSVLYIDIVAAGTVDEHILAVLRNKRGISSVVMGDQLKEWI